MSIWTDRAEPTPPWEIEDEEPELRYFIETADCRAGKEPRWIWQDGEYYDHNTACAYCRQWFEEGNQKMWGFRVRSLDSRRIFCQRVPQKFRKLLLAATA